MALAALRKKFRKFSDKKQAAILCRFFKTGPGEYAEGDRFLGIKVPVIRRFARSCHGLSLDEIRVLLRSRFHEERLLALILLVFHFDKGDEKKKEKIYRFYLDSTAYINNWDLVDVTAKFIVGAYLLKRQKGVLDTLACSDNLWERRIAILSTFHFIEKNQFNDTLRISRLLLHDSHDLIHKAVGWMLREVGKRDLKVLEGFLRLYACRMPRVMLRYSIERLSRQRRLFYLKNKIFKSSK